MYNTRQRYYSTKEALTGVDENSRTEYREHSGDDQGWRPSLVEPQCFERYDQDVERKKPS